MVVYVGVRVECFKPEDSGDDSNTVASYRVVRWYYVSNASDCEAKGSTVQAVISSF